ncbi:hypothetical protein IEQ34_005069 [Dendrobium chrysotoxum]|uniref:UDP-glucuronic acid decarboxylase 1 n=1 Tax=Dendrobium chrysotoxum TaxID=161865 RepID=A0AAV7H7U6_DENCH|nr:hypothetical protein IEQ34_005069 [Dendrobium chrysotoxum]
MKQIHKQSSANQHQIPTHSPTYPVKNAKQHNTRSSLPRSAASYLLREQRLLFVLVGAVIASSFFLLHPYYHPPTPAATLPFFRRSAVAGDSTAISTSTVIGRINPGGGRRVPVGLRKPPMRIVVTGGAGFVGSHLVDKLIARGDSVIVIDNFFTGRKENLVHLFGNPRFELIRHDVIEPILLEVDQIYHLACWEMADVFFGLNPGDFSRARLQLSKRIGARFLLTSTSEVYGDPLEHPQKETYWGHVNPIGVRSCYDEGKRTAETLTMDYHRGAEVEVRIARIFNTYGPRMCIDDGRVVSNFVAQALRRQPMTVYGDGKQTRSFQFVSDLAAVPLVWAAVPSVYVPIGYCFDASFSPWLLSLRSLFPAAYEEFLVAFLFIWLLGCLFVGLVFLGFSPWQLSLRFGQLPLRFPCPLAIVLMLHFPLGCCPFDPCFAAAFEEFLVAVWVVL